MLRGPSDFLRLQWFDCRAELATSSSSSAEVVGNRQEPAEITVVVPGASVQAAALLTGSGSASNRSRAGDTGARPLATVSWSRPTAVPSI